MNYEFFIAKHLIKKDKDSISGPYVTIAIIAIAIGLSAMIISVAIVRGFQTEIRNKVAGFGSHIQITSYDFNRSFEATPVNEMQDFYNGDRSWEGVDYIQVFANKAGIVKTETEIQGVVFKGIGDDFNWDYFLNNIVEGTAVEVKDSLISNDILISRMLAGKLDLKLNDDLRVYFLNQGSKQPRGRKFHIKGIYNTGLEEFDNYYIIGDIKQIQKLNNWNEDEVAGFEVVIKDFSKLEDITNKIYKDIDYDLKATSIKELYPQIFDWLKLQDMNVVVIIILMILVAGITMISTLLVLILERTNMIGILKALGSQNWHIRKIFIYQAIYIIGTGLVFGNLIGIGFSFLQKFTGIIPLPEESYYISYVPIQLDWFLFLILNLGSLLICTLILLIPSYIVSKITPMKAIRFD